MALVWIALAALAQVLLTGPGAGAQEPDDDQLAKGAAVFQDTCAACHGTRAEGGPGTTPETSGPAIDAVEVGYVDMTLRTGRMPFPSRAAGVYREDVDDDEREALVAWMADRFDLPGEIPEVGEGDPARGQELYVHNCAACHGAGGAGGISGAGATVPAVDGLDPVATVEAIRVGPFQMPAFGEQVLDDEEADAIAAYLVAAGDAPTSLLGLPEVDEVSGALFAAGLAAIAIVALVVTAYARRLTSLGPGPAPGLPDDATPGDEVEP